MAQWKMHELKSYFARVNSECRDDPQWKHGIEMCDAWISLAEQDSVEQHEVDSIVKRLKEETNPGSGWLDLTLQFKGWARACGFQV